ncbi:DUF5711 family protein [Caproiciproducens faecalis]|uniref:Uncharacterized protein n=1 Tax=Caproiciproducens faecalis TaxID=2820301 RepID=A0ABS7DJ63_9FIRM|nr:DUF5711 family protein [Caproiciproducens faecalis]MBW7571330.1 hypothetical protein [Caproiciproducens faecalis]
MSDRGQRFDTTEIDTAKYQQKTENRRQKRRNRRESRVPRWVYRIIVILILCVFTMLIWFNRNNLTPSNVLEWVQNSVVGMGIGDGFPTKIAGNTVLKGNFQSVNKEAVIVSDTALTVLNSTAKAVVSRQHSFSRPVMKVNGNRILIYSLGGKGYRIETQSKTLFKEDDPQDILAGTLAANGRYALITEADGYLGCLTAYTADNKILFHYWFSDYYPTAVALSPDGTKAAVAAVGAKDGTMTSAVYLLNFSNSKPVEPAAVYPENMMMDISCSDNGTVTAVGDRLTAVIGADGKTKTNFDYQGLHLAAYSMNNGKTALGLAPYGSAGNGKLVVLDDTGTAAASVPFAKSVDSVSLYADAMAVLSQGQVHFYSATAGTSTGTCDAGSDARAIALHDETSVYILGVSEIRLANSK